MKTINATLLSSQKLPVGRGFATASLADNGRLHPTQVVSSSYSGGRVIGCECGTFYVRIRYVPSSNKLDYQKITDPTQASQWTTWTNLVASDVNGPLGIGIFWTGTYVVITYQLISTGDVKYRRATDGAAWSAAATARTPLAAGCNLAGISGTSPACGLMESYQAQIYWQSYNDSANTWGAAESAGATFTTTTPEIAAFKDISNSRYVVAVSVSGFVSWAVNAIVGYTRAVGSATWSTGQILFSGNGLSGSFVGLNFAQRQINGYWWLSFWRARLWNVGSVSNVQVSASNDGLFWDDPLPTRVGGNEYSLTILPAPSAGTWANAYLGLESAVWRLDTYTYWSGATVVAYRLITGRGGHEEGGGANGRGGASPNQPATISNLTVLLDNRDGSLSVTPPRLFSVLSLSRGLLVAGVQYAQSAGTWYVTGFRYLMADGLLEITATDARGLLTSWFADTAYSYRLATVKFLVEWLCAKAGVHSVSFDATASWTETISAFTHAVAENAESSLRSLADRVPFEFVPQEDGSLYFYVPSAGPSAVYTFGDGASDHHGWYNAPPRAPATGGSALGKNDPSRTWQLDTSQADADPPRFGAAESVTYLQDIGSPPRNRVAEAVDWNAITATGRRRSLIVNDRRLTNDAATTEAAAALLVAAMERRRTGIFETPPAFNIEPGDVIAFSGTTYPATAGPWRIETIDEHFNQAGPRPFYQRVSVRGTA